MTLLQCSKLVKAGVADGQLQIQGAIYHGGLQMPPGIVEWLGTHPDQPSVLHKILQAPTTSQSMSVTNLSVEDLPPDEALAQHEIVQELLQALQAGNSRFLASGAPPASRWRAEKLADLAETGTSPGVIILAGANGEVRAPENLFDAQVGDLAVHRTCGALSGRREGCAIGFLERQVKQNPGVPLLLILGDVRDPAVGLATAQVQRIASVLKSANAQMAMEQLAPAAVQCLRQMMDQDNQDQILDSQQQKELVAVATEFHVFYVMERLLLDSTFIFDQVRSRRLQVQGAVVLWDGEVRMLGGHTDLPRVMEQRARADRHRRKGLKLGPQKRGNMAAH